MLPAAEIAINKSVHRQMLPLAYSNRYNQKVFAILLQKGFITILPCHVLLLAVPSAMLLLSSCNNTVPGPAPHLQSCVQIGLCVGLIDLEYPSCSTRL